jgi:hypothetical protein
MIVYKCIDKECGCVFKDKDKDGISCPKCGNPITPLNLNPTVEELSNFLLYKEIKDNLKKKGLTVMVSLTSTDIFKDILNVTAAIYKDNNAPQYIKKEIEKCFKRHGFDLGNCE